MNSDYHSDKSDAVPEGIPGGPVVELSGLAYRYASSGKGENGEPALGGVTLTLRGGAIAGVLGRNGSGKTTLL